MGRYLVIIYLIFFILVLREGLTGDDWVGCSDNNNQTYISNYNPKFGALLASFRLHSLAALLTFDSPPPHPPRSPSSPPSHLTSFPLVRSCPSPWLPARPLHQLCPLASAFRVNCVRTFLVLILHFHVVLSLFRSVLLFHSGRSSLLSFPLPTTRITSLYLRLLSHQIWFNDGEEVYACREGRTGTP
jgi:hypothetical protein